jgi:hypothetical protein
MGTLFWLVRVLGDFDVDNVPGRTIVLAQSSEYTYYLNFPSDIQFNPESETAKEYLEMQGQYEFIVNSFRLKRNVLFLV